MASHSADQECYQHAPISLAHIQEKTARLYESVKEEIAILAKEGFEDVSEYDIVKILESLSLPLTIEEMAEMDIQMYIKRFKRKLQQK
jgi:hypothetical protein